MAFKKILNKIIEDRQQSIKKDIEGKEKEIQLVNSRISEIEFSTGTAMIMRPPSPNSNYMRLKINQRKLESAKTKLEKEYKKMSSYV